MLPCPAAPVVGSNRPKRGFRTGSQAPSPRGVRVIRKPRRRS